MGTSVRGWRGWVALVGSCLLANAWPAWADVLDDVRTRGELIWGGDQEGGGPYIYADPQDPDRLVGFEVELADLLAAELGVRARFMQADWNTLPEFLRAGKVDIVLNGYEWTPQRAARMLATRPYYIYELQLLAREHDGQVRSWDDLRRRPDRPRRSVSVLSGTAAAHYLASKWAGDVEVAEYNGNTDAMAQVRAGVHDATLADLPVAIHFRGKPQGAGLRFIGEPIEPGYYVIFAATGQQRLVDALNAAIERALHDGRLQRIYEKYDLWTSAQETLATASVSPGAETALTGWMVVRQYGPKLLWAALVTVQVSVLAMPLAVIVGLLVALGRLYGPGWVRGVLAAYVEILRGTPVMLQLYVLYFLLPTLVPFPLNPVTAAVVGLGINYSAYEAEIYRAGIQAVPVGQMQAALALGLSRRAAIRRIILPQATRIVIPPVTNDFIALFKDTSVCSVIAVTELTKQYNMAANGTGAILELAAMTALLYLAMSYPLSRLARRMEMRLGVHGARA